MLATAERSSEDWAQGRRRPRWGLLGAVAVALCVAAGGAQLLRPAPRPVLRLGLPARLRVAGPRPVLPWPAGGESAVGASGVGVMAVAGGQTPQPIASLAKIMTALVVLRDHPLAPGAGGPALVVTPRDFALYTADRAGGQSVLPVASGERLDERQLLQGLLLLGANNAAVMLARWDAGSQRAFVARMNQLAQELGLGHTRYADASGLSPATVSSAADQLRLAARAMALRAFRHIVAAPQATLPVAGTIYNVNYELGRAGIVGVKTGATTAAGGCFVAAAYRVVGGQRVLVLAAVLGQQGVQPLAAALQAGRNLVQAAGAALRPVTLLRPGQAVGTLTVPWAPPVPVRAARGVTLLGWGGLQGRWQLRPRPPAAAHGLPQGSPVGLLLLTLGSQHAAVPLLTGAPVPPPPLPWRLLRRP